MRQIQLVWIFVPLSGALALMAPNAAAQNVQNKDNYVLSSEASKRTLTKDVISGATAEKIAHICEDFAIKHRYAGVIYILDPFGDVVSVHRMDGTRPVQVDGALSKARAALFYRVNTHELANRLANDPVVQVSLREHGFHPVPGGVPIVVDGKMIGVIGVTGSDPLDEECAFTGLHEVLGTPIPPPDKLQWSIPVDQKPSQR